MHRVARRDDGDDLFRVPVDQRHLAGVTQRHREEVVEVVGIHLLLRSLLRRHQHFPGRLHLRHAVFGRLRRRLLHVARHEVDLFVGKLARSAPIGHPRRRAVLDEDLQVLGAFLQSDVRREWLARGPLAQHAVTTGAPFEIDLAPFLELRLGHRRRFRIDVLVHLHLGQGRAAGLIADLLLGDRLLLCPCHANGQRQHRQRAQRFSAPSHDRSSPPMKKFAMLPL